MQIEYKGKKYIFEGKVTPVEVAKKIGIDLKPILVAEVNGELFDLSRNIPGDAKIDFFGFDSDKGKKVFWHSSTHILATAVKRLYPDAVLGIGPSIDEGFYYDFYNLKIGDNDLERIEKEAKKVVDEDLKFIRTEKTVQEAKKEVANNKFKLEILDNLKGTVSFYSNGEFSDLCRGPHIPSTRYVKALKLLKVAGAYWRGDSSKEVMTRIYGISFPSKKDMDEYLKMIEERKEHDHKKIGKELGLFFFSEESPGSPFFLPNGTVVYNELIRFARELDLKYGYQEIITPIIAKIDVWKTSGHFDKYRENMYKVSPFSSENEEYGLKPMNCPFSVIAFKTRTRSYRDLPLRLADYGFLHRYELEGTLDGLLRTRILEQNDAHIYVTEEQIEEEILRIFEMMKEIYEKFDLKPMFVLATRPEKRIGSDEIWDASEEALRKALTKSGYKYTVKEGDGAFYGPKIDVYVLDFSGKPEYAYATSTIQIDFNLTQRFQATYVGKDNKEHFPVVIHRSIMGSIGRFMGIILENGKGDLPLWLSPVQARVLTITERNKDYAHKLLDRLKKEGLRVDIDDGNSTLDYKIRSGQLEKIPFLIVIGDKEEKNNTIALRGRDGKTEYGLTVDDFIRDAVKAIKNRSR
ncbi:threonine--tRNA ligase [Candidatus Parvarchaeota archaeon]|nr:threonine--tRNA ligase [Candidatus Parvarchaeota archaeon]